MLIVARALLGIAGATLMPSTLALIRGIFDDRASAAAFGIWAAGFAPAAARARWSAGVLLRALLVGLGLPVRRAGDGGAGGARAGLLPELRDPDAGPAGHAGAVLSLAGVLGVVYAIKEAVQGGPRSGRRRRARCSGAAALAAFVRRQHRHADPLDRPALFRPALRAAARGELRPCFGLSGMVFFISQYLQLVLGPVGARGRSGPSPRRSATSPAPCSPRRAANRFRPAWTLSASLAVTAIGFGLLRRSGRSPGSRSWWPAR